MFHVKHGCGFRGGVKLFHVKQLTPLPGVKEVRIYEIYLVERWIYANF